MISRKELCQDRLRVKDFGRNSCQGKDLKKGESEQISREKIYVEKILKETTHKKRPHGPLVSLEKEQKEETWRVTIVR